MTSTLRRHWITATAWLLLLAAYLAVCELVPAGPTRTSLADVLLCLMPLLVNGALLINTVTPDRRKKAFWMLLASSCTLWLAGQAFWTYTEVYQRRHAPYLLNGSHFSVDIIFY